MSALGVCATLAVVCATTGCGAIFHASQTVTFATEPGDVVYRDGVPLGAAAAPPGSASKPPTAQVFVAQTQGFVAAAPGKKVTFIEPEKHVDWLAVSLDALWCLTIIGIAAPISDAVMGTFVKVTDHVDVRLEQDSGEANPMPVYSIGGTTFAATDESAPR